MTIKENGEIEIENKLSLEQNLEDIEKFYKFLNHKTFTVFQVFESFVDKEITNLPSKPSPQYFIPANNSEMLLKLCNKYQLSGLLCLGINERSTKQKTLGDIMTKINTLLFDIDVRKNKKVKGSSPNTLKQEAYKVALNCKKRLEELGFIIGLITDSGNGYHIYIKIDLLIPSYQTKEDFENTTVYKKLAHLEDQLKQFNTKNVEIDNISKDIIRRVKIAGTYNIKRYKDTKDNKYKLMDKKDWRIAKILYLNEEINEEQNNKTFMKLPLKNEITVKKKDTANMFKSKENPDLTKIRLKDFKNLLEKDDKLRKLYNAEITFGDTEENDFKSRSEAELSLIIKLMNYNMHDSHIIEILKTCKIGKWKETGDAYKITTMNKAYDFIKKNTKKRIQKEENESYDIYEIVDLIVDIYPIKTIIHDDSNNEELCMYKNGYWKKYKKSEINKIIGDVLREREIPYTNSKRNDILRLVMNETLINFEEFDKNPYEINLENGILNLKTGSFKKHSKDCYHLRRIPIEYDDEALCPLVDDFLIQVFNNEDQNLIRELAGICLTPIMIYQKAFMYYGTGNNGKTTFFNFLSNFVGIGNCSKVDLTELQVSHLFAKIEHKLLNFKSDIGSKTKLNIQYFKEYVGNELRVLINKKYKDPYDIPPTAKLIYSCNTTFPSIPEDTDKGFFRKWIIIECPNEFDGREDPKLLDKLCNKKELSGFLNECIKAFRNLDERGCFEEKYNNWEDVKEFWFMKINSFSEFVEQECQKSFELIADKDETLKAFNEWLINQGKKTTTKTKLTQLINEAPDFGTKRIRINNVRKVYYCGFQVNKHELIVDSKPKFTTLA